MLNLVLISQVRARLKRSKNFNIELREVIFGCCVTNNYDENFSVLSLVTHGVTSCDGSFAIEDIYEDVYEDELRR